MSNDARHNLDGVVIPLFSNRDTQQVDEYFQVFRNGVTEYVYSMFENVQDRVISLHHIEMEVIRNLRFLLGFQSNLGIEPPLVIMLSLARVRDYRLKPGIPGVYGHSAETSPISLRKDNLLLTDIIIENYEQDIEVLMKPIFDILWNAGGWDGSMNYDKQGARIKRKSH